MAVRTRLVLGPVCGLFHTTGGSVRCCGFSFASPFGVAPVRRWIGVWIGLLAGLGLFQGAALGGATPPALPPPAQWIPEDAVLVMEVPNPQEVLDVALAPEILEKIQQLPAWKNFLTTPNYRELRQGVEFLEKSLRMDWISGVKKFFSGGLTVSVHPQEAVLIAVDCESEGMLAQLHEIFRGIATFEAGKQKQPNRVQSTEYRGVTTWSFGPQEVHCVIGRRLLLSNKPDLLKAVLDRRENSHLRRLATLPEYKTARQTAGEYSTARVYANLKALSGIPAIQKVLRTPSEPLSALLFTGLVDSLRRSTWMVLGLRVEGNQVVLQANVDGRPTAESLSQFSLAPTAGEGAFPLLEVPRQLISMSFYRDLHRFYAAKDKLFPERTSELIFFENMMGIFFTGRDLTEEVLGQLESQIRLVVAAQEYDPGIGTPAIQLPAFALVFRMKEPDKFFEVVEEAWQKALGLVNFTQGQQAQPGLILDKNFHGPTKYTVAYFSAKDEKNRKALDVRFNFRPTLARAGEFAILSSTEQLACDLMDVLAKDKAGKNNLAPGVHSAVELRFSQIASLLRTNREALVRQNMVEKGHTRQEAENEIDMLTMLLNAVESLKLQIGTRPEGTQATLEVKVQIP